jgi:indole-3-glycerol phosphate synthase
MILTEILRHKEIEVAARVQSVPQSALESAIEKASPPRGFRSALQSSPRMGLIAEVKCSSPSAGRIAGDFDPAKIAKGYEDAGANCLSVLTDERYFQGALEHLRLARAATGLPVLRKDFVVDPYQIYEARAWGADAVLLIAAAMDEQKLAGLKNLATSLGMDVLVEVHSAREMDAAIRTGADLIGINSRNLQTFVTNLSVIEELAGLVPPGAVLVGESGIRTRADVERLRRSGVRAILVGETLMRAPDVKSAVLDLLHA